MKKDFIDLLNEKHKDMDDRLMLEWVLVYLGKRGKGDDFEQWLERNHKRDLSDLVD